MKHKVLSIKRRQSKLNYSGPLKINFPFYFGSSREKSCRKVPRLGGKRCQRKTSIETVRAGVNPKAQS